MAKKLANTLPQRVSLGGETACAYNPRKPAVVIPEESSVNSKGDMGRFEFSRPFSKQTAGWGISGCVWLMLACLSLPAHGLEYPWILLSPERDSRDPEVRDQDEAQSLNMVAVMNQTETLFDHHLIWKKVAIKNLLALNAPFCEMHFDAVNPVGLSADEQSILGEYLKRGGFILFFIDTYPYPHDEFWAVKEWPIIDLLTKELPASDPDFTTGKATDKFPIFKVHYQTGTADVIRHELNGNPNTPNRTLLFYRNRLCCFVMGQYGYLEGGEWVPMSRPFPRNFSLELKSYQLIVNIYTYSVVK